MGDYFICPQCGAEVPKKAKSCPSCGSDEKTGWSEFTYMDSIETPDENEYMDILNNEFPENKTISQKSKNHTWIAITGTLLLLLIGLMILRGMF
ncbi:MAG TPA: zinc-ribbon domain-containing protein [Chitinispirillaceae bacterium]|nr:zinc-ribbon domain-containing protein [Chitinispirillaceae bacterium]